MTEELQEQHRKFGVSLFNQVWELLEKQDRTPEEDDKMLHTAHASRYHWGEIGQPVNFARGEWQISRVYAVLNRGEPALYHAQKCLTICQQNNIGDFDLAYAYEALARASAVAGNQPETNRYLKLAQEAGEQISEDDDQKLFYSDLETIPGYQKNS
jgi:hypothetical protein